MCGGDRSCYDLRVSEKHIGVASVRTTLIQHTHTEEEEGITCGRITVTFFFFLA